jgi:hypothetical protein
MRIWNLSLGPVPSRTYPTGIKGSDKELAALALQKGDFHGEWNYALLPP